MDEKNKIIIYTDENGLGGGGYWKELLERIRDIRSTEKVLYRQVLEIYATSIDYDPRASTSGDSKWGPLHCNFTLKKRRQPPLLELS